MDKAFKDKSGKVVLVDSSAPVRTLMTDTVRSLGFTDITSVPTIKDALAIMEVESVGWVLTPLLADHPENALHLLRICTESADLKNVRVSLLIDESESYCLSAAFQHGLISYHRRPFTKDSLKAELAELMGRYERAQWLGTMLAADYLRDHLRSQDRYDELLQLEKSLIEAFPDSVPLLFNLVEPLVRTGAKEEAKATLRQLGLLFPDQLDRIKSLTNQFLHGEPLDDDQLTGQEGSVNVLGVKQAVIVDSDGTVQKNVSDMLKQLGVANVVEFSDGAAALDFLKSSPEPDLLVQEWRIPKISGPLFIQRAKHRGAQSTPIVVLSSLLRRDDMPLVKEMGVAKIVEKPFERPSLLQALIWTVQQDRSPTEQASMERKMRDLIRQQRIGEAREIKERYMADASIATGMKKAVDAEFAYADRQYEAARNLAIEALKLAGDSIFLLNLLGKIMMQLRDFESALKCFQKARTLSPMNIERLCSIAEAHSEMGNGEKAKEVLQEASSMDPDNVMVKESEAKIAVNAGQLDHAKKIMGQLESLDNVVSYMNNQAVALARIGKFDDSIEQYRKTIESIPDDRDETRAIVIYNCALALVRNGKLAEANESLRRCAKLPANRITKKAQSLLKRVESSIQSGEALRLNSGVSPSSASADGDDSMASKRSLMAAIQTKKGELGCFLLFTPKDVDGKSSKLLATPPRFNRRTAIERGEARGADKVMKAG